MRLSLISRLLLALALAGCALPAAKEENMPAQAAVASAQTEVPAATALSATPEIARQGLASSASPAQKIIDIVPEPTLPPRVLARFATATARASAPQVGAQPAENASQYVVAWGDTLSKIASIHGLSVETLIATNNLLNPDLLSVGQVIKLPQPPDKNSPSFHILPDARLVRSASAQSFDVADFLASQPGILRDLSGFFVARQADGSAINVDRSASEIVEQIALDFSVDPRVLLAFLEYRASLLSRRDVTKERLRYPIISPETSGGINRPSLVAQLTWLADQLNYGYYDKKYRADEIIEFADGSRLLYHPELKAGTAAIQHVFAKLSSGAQWQRDVSAEGFSRVYRDLFGDPFAEDQQESAAALEPMKPTEPLKQPELSLPFRPGEIWRFTGGFHGGWGNGSAWAAIDFAPPAESQSVSYCYTSSFPVTAVARGTIARLPEGAVILDLDLDGNEGTGWTILYLHISHAETLQTGQIVAAGDVLGYPSCAGGFSTATHLHIARRYNGEWLPADCLLCPATLQVPPFTLGAWRVVGLQNEVYQGYLLNQMDNRSVIAEQGRGTYLNEISW